MKKYFYTFFAFLLFAFGVQAQRIVQVQPGNGTLNQAILGDTLENGDRTDPNTVYQLARGFTYTVTEPLEWSGFNLRLEGTAGSPDNPLPIIYQGASDGGSTFAQLFMMRGDSTSLDLESVHVSGTTNIGTRINRLIRINADECRVTVRNSILEDGSQSVFRLNGNDISVYMDSSLVTGIGEPFDPNNGRLFDNRGFPVDTLFVTNSTVYNISSTLYRSGGGSALNVFIARNNTFAHVGQRGLDFDQTSEIYIEENIFADIGFLGHELGQTYYVINGDTATEETTFLFRNNNVFNTPEVEALIEGKIKAEDNDTLVAWRDTSLIAPFWNNIVVMENNLDEPLNFVNPASIPIQFINSYITDTLAGAEIEFAGEWSREGLTRNETYSAEGTGEVDRYTEFHNWCYDGDALTTNNAIGGGPIGDVSKCSTELTTTKNILVSDAALSLYPNPTNSLLYINQQDGKRITELSVFDLRGRLLKRDLSNSEAIILDVSKYQNGTYIVKSIDESGQVYTNKFVKI